MSQFIDDYQRRERQREARLPTYKAALLRLLRRAKVDEAIIEYDGEGDDGQIDSVTLLDAMGTCLPDKPLSARAQQTFSDLHLFKDTLHGALEAFAWELLAIHHSGFENNEGAYGTIKIDVAEQTVEIVHSARIVDVYTNRKVV